MKWEIGTVCYDFLQPLTRRDFCPMLPFGAPNGPIDRLILEQWPEKTVIRIGNNRRHNHATWWIADIPCGALFVVFEVAA